ncbi:MAG: MscL family protein [bacterium]|nr:MscL family protein [bacterium]
MEGFLNFIREQGVVGLAVGFILGGAVSRTVSAIVEDLINPIVGVLLNRVGGLEKITVNIGGAVLKWGDLVSHLINLIIIAAIVYYGVKSLGLDKLDREKDIVS